VLQSATADHQAGAVTVAFARPFFGTVTEYRVRCRETNTVVRATSASPVTFMGLPRGRDLTFEVVAVNRVGPGPGPASAASQPIKIGEVVRARPRRSGRAWL
jgi:hypothetical protein